MINTIIEIERFILKALRKICSKTPLYYHPSLWNEEYDFDKVSDKIYNLLKADKPCMIARFGDGELHLTINSLFVSKGNHCVWRYITGRQYQWWWNNEIKNKMLVFPKSDESFINFGKLMLDSYKYSDIQAIWSTQYRNLHYIDELNKDVYKIALITLDPYWSSKPWTRALKGKKVLVLSMFDDLIKKQYDDHRTQLFQDPNILPEFELITLKALSYDDFSADRFPSWFDAVKYMEDEIDKIDYDICLISCGPPGYPIAAHVKRMGKKAVHLGGALQLLFGIKGKRWEDPEYGASRLKRKNAYPELFNEYWIRPDKQHTPKIAKNIEGGCYW